MSIPFATTSWSDLTPGQKDEFYAWISRRKSAEDFENGITEKQHLVDDRCDGCTSGRWEGQFGDEARREALAASDQGRLAEWERELMEPLPDGDAQITAPAEEETTEQLLDRLESTGDAERQQAEEKQKEQAARVLAAKATVAGHYSEDAAWLDDDRLKQIAGTLDYFADAASVLAARQGFCSEFDRIAQLVGIQSTKNRRERTAGLPLFFDSMLVPDVLLHGIARAVSDSGYREQYETLTEEFDILDWPEAQEKETHYDVTYTVTVHSYDSYAEDEQIIEAISNGEHSRTSYEESDCDDDYGDYNLEYDTSDARAFMSALAVLGVTV